MSKRALKSIIMLGIIAITMIILTSVSNATLSISTSKSTVSPGETFNVTVSVSSNEAGAINLSVSNGTLSQSYIDLMTQSSVTISCTAGSSGTVSISASGLVANYTTETEGTQSASKKVTIKQPETNTSNSNNSSSGGSTTNNSNTNTNTNTTKPTETKSSNSNLSALQIAEGAITPEFSSGAREYQINVSNEVTKLSIAATPADSKATTKITGNEELVVGENIIEVIVTAEDGSTTTYKITAVRAEAELNLQALSIFYIDENGEKVPLTLNPIFEAGIYEYTLGNISYKIDKIIVEGIATRENAEISITGNEELKEGENTIQIKVVVKDDSGLEEEKTYTIKLNKESAPVETPLSVWDKIKNWFVGAGTWVNTNANNILSVSLIITTTAFIGLTIYFAYDYKNYQKLLEQLAAINKSNLMEKANVALVTENVRTEEIEENVGQNNEEEKKEDTKIEETQEELNEEVEETEKKRKTKAEKGKRFKQ